MKNLKALIFIFLANIVSGAGQGISMIAIPWYFARQNEMELFGLFYIATNILSLFWVPYAGTLVDRFDRKKVFLAVNLITGIALALLVLFGHIQGGLPIYLIALAFTFTFLNYNIHYPTLYAWLQEITEKKYYGRITSAIEIQGQFTSILAGVAATFLLEGTLNDGMRLFGVDWNLGFTVPKMSIEQIFMIDASSYFISFLLILFVSYISLVDKKIEEGSLRERLAGGIRFLKSNPSVFWFGLGSYIIFLCALIEGFYLTAIYVEDILKEGANVYAMNEISYSAGALIAGVVTRKIFQKFNIPSSIIIMTLLTALSFTIVAHTRSEFILYVFAFILGLTNAGTRILRVSYLFSVVPNELYGRSTSIFKIANISLRIIFLSLFSLSFFHRSGHIIYAYDILTLVMISAAILLIIKYKTFNLTIKA